jgi:nitrate/TMAO reductase-like tetraheme cytochrome c subunit
MSKKSPNMLKKEDFVNIEDYLSAYLVAERDRDVFVSRCTQCHSLECVQTAMDAGKIEGVAKKMAQKSGAGISEQEAQNTEDYLMNYIKREKVDIHHAAFESTCSSCHSLDKIKTAHVDKSKAKEIVEKMARKPKSQINPEDFDSYEEYLMKYITK